MRIGLALADGDGVETAAEADRLGIPAVLVPPGPLGAGIALASAIAAVTRDTRIVVTVLLGVEHPVTLAEEISVVDHISSGRVVALVDPGGLKLEEAEEDLALLRASWSGRWVRHRGARWTVPAGIHGENSPESVAVTPLPAQLQMPVWLSGALGPALALGRGLPYFVDSPEALVARDVETLSLARVPVSGDLDADRATVLGWAEAGLSHAFVVPPDGGVDLEQHVARYLIPEVAMPGFPRIIAESEWPARWPV
ncbi:LLM class flavin-dependent oxidoreductase [Amnibacterium flavum]|uniref:Luciferase-like domain-containing protein n=1 Tax=Amnibacterium flavum TaxID=2173173 RepID=A0A2V1HW80_9MICO|nr:LLM class flavin-dependent oxidoreductase [Amnibacterium flavum]PVZ96092.1 hypothetical protein DDQ50_06545 [Amnibacterium flavum]